MLREGLGEEEEEEEDKVDEAPRRTRQNQKRREVAARGGCSYSGFVTCRFADQLKDTNL